MNTTSELKNILSQYKKNKFLDAVNLINQLFISKKFDHIVLQEAIVIFKNTKIINSIISLFIQYKFTEYYNSWVSADDEYKNDKLSNFSAFFFTVLQQFKKFEIEPILNDVWKDSLPIIKKDILDYSKSSISFFITHTFDYTQKKSHIQNVKDEMIETFENTSFFPEISNHLASF